MEVVREMCANVREELSGPRASQREFKASRDRLDDDVALFHPESLQLVDGTAQ